MQSEPQAEHQWLQRLVGQWTIESECVMGPDQPPMKTEGRETVRSLGGLWILGEGSMGTPEGGDCSTLLTLGYDPRIGRFVGTFIASMMTHLWPYNGSLDPSGKVLTLDSEGPGFSGEGQLVRYQDIIEFESDDCRTLRSRMLGEDGQWHWFMKAVYRRQNAATG